MGNVSLQQRTRGDTCAKCMRKFEPGDRVTNAFIVVAVGVDPKNILERGVNLSGTDFEILHFDCENRSLTPTRLDLVLGR